MKEKLLNLIFWFFKLDFYSFLKLVTSKIFLRKEIVLHWNNENIYIRNNRSDLAIFKQIFLDQVYKAGSLNKSDNNGVIIDLGANVGYFTKYLCNQFPHFKYYLMEPNPENCIQIRKNLSNTNNWHLTQGGIGESSRYLCIENQDAMSCSNRYLNVSDNSCGIPSYTLNEYLSMNQIDEIFILKIDIEGAEKFILNDLKTILLKTKYLMIELHDHLSPGLARDFFKLFSEFNFKFEALGDVFIIELLNEDIDFN